jgi:predicted dehydrogenase
MKQFGMAIIGLGVVGRRMCEQVARHGGFRIVAAHDASPAAAEAAAQAHPGLPRVGRAADAIAHPEVDIVYVAVPPLAHAGYVRDAIAAGKAVLCEKPLGVDVAESARLVAEVEASRLPQAVNFVFASSAAVDALDASIQAPGFELRAVEVQVRFHRWPRGWQDGAIWLSRADQGGFTREVLSHFVYLLDRLLGDVALTGASVRRGVGGAAESALAASLRAGGVPVSIAGSVGGQAPDVVEARFIGAGRELRLIDWFRLVEHSPGRAGEPVAGLPDDPRSAAFLSQLDQLHAMLAGRAHTLPDFAAAWRVQRVIEAMLAS